MSEITILDMCLYWLLLALLVIDLLTVFRYLFSAAWLASHPRDEAQQPDADLPGVSVIVTSHNEAHNLRLYLQALLSQKYPRYEVIVVNTESQDSTREVIEEFMHRDRRLHMSFVPQGTHGLNPRMMALTLGAKAAQYDILLFAEPDTRPESDRWISSFVAPFETAATQVVVGPTTCYPEDRCLARIIRYDFALSQLRTIGRVVLGCDYDGSLRNVAYRKAAFFRLLAHEHLYSSANTVAICSPESTVWREADVNKQIWLQNKRGQSPYIYCRFLSMLLVLTIVVLSAVGVLSWWTAILAAGLMLIRWVVVLMALGWNTSKLGWKAFDWRILIYDGFLPILNMYSYGRKETGY